MDENLCPNCQKAKASTRKSRLCGTCHKKSLIAIAAGSAGIPTVGKPVISEDLLAKAALAKTTEDWQKLAAQLSPIMTDILNGTVKATAAQASLIKDIFNRAFGKPIAAQQEKRLAAGVIILPALDDGAKKLICPKCGYDATKGLVEAESGSANSVPVVNS